jgi:hypothetical protein
MKQTAVAVVVIWGAATSDGVPKRFFTGEMEEAAIWPRALTDAELATFTPARPER